MEAQEQLQADATHPPLVDSELNPDDIMVPDEDAFEEDGEAEAQEVGKRDFVVDVFAHGSPRAFYEQMLDLLGTSQSHVLVALTTSAHPGLILAGRSRQQQVHVLLDRHFVWERQVPKREHPRVQMCVQGDVFFSCRDVRAGVRSLFY